MKSQKQYIQESIDRMVRECINEMFLDEKKKKGSKKDKKGPKKVEYKNKDLFKNKKDEQ